MSSCVPYNIFELLNYYIISVVTRTNVGEVESLHDIIVLKMLYIYIAVYFRLKFSSPCRVLSTQSDRS